MVSGRQLRRLCPDRTLFLLCDVQEKFRKAIPLFGNMLININKLLKVGKEFEVPVVGTEQYPKKLGNTCQELDTSGVIGICPKTKFTMLVPEVVALMKENLKERPTDVVLFGVEAHICLLQTAIDFLDQKYKVHIPLDCIASRTNQDRDVAIKSMRDMGCFVQTSESIAFSLLGDKENSEFKAVSKLVAQISADMQLAKVPANVVTPSKKKSDKKTDEKKITNAPTKTVAAKAPPQNKTSKNPGPRMSLGGQKSPMRPAPMKAAPRKK